MRPAILTLIVALCTSALGACGFVGFPGVYKIDVEQGNIVTQELADQLKPGMSRRQVRFILGTPLIEDPFNQNRWDYPYVKRNGQDVLSEAHLSVIFEGDSLAEVKGDYLPPAWQSASDPAPDTASASTDDEDEEYYEEE
ncbi:MAG: hypothetical protein Hals2KO_31060 [Halioglobus sp.]